MNLDFFVGPKILRVVFKGEAGFARLWKGVASAKM
jgi:hypothetical protein